MLFVLTERVSDDNDEGDASGSDSIDLFPDGTEFPKNDFAASGDFFFEFHCSSSYIFTLAINGKKSKKIIRIRRKANNKIKNKIKNALEEKI